MIRDIDDTIYQCTIWIGHPIMLKLSLERYNHIKSRHLIYANESPSNKTFFYRLSSQEEVLAAAEEILHSPVTVMDHDRMKLMATLCYFWPTGYNFVTKNYCYCVKAIFSIRFDGGLELCTIYPSYR